MLRTTLMSIMLLASAFPAHAEGLEDLAAGSFPLFPCSDGWSGCQVDGQEVSPEMVRDGTSRPHPADMRFGFFDLEPLPAMSPFVSLSNYSTKAEAEAEAQAEAVAQAEAEAEAQAEAEAVAAAEAEEAQEENGEPATKEGDDGSAVAAEDASTAEEASTKAGDPAGDDGSTAEGSATDDGREPIVVEDDTVAQADGSEATENDGPESNEEATREGENRDALANEGSDARENTSEPEVPVTNSGASSADAGCDDLVVLQAPAMVGQLGAERIRCLEARISAGGSQTTRDKISRVLMIDAEARGDRGDWERLVSRHLSQISYSDPDLCLSYSIQLSRTGRYSSVIKWSEAALENKQKWSGSTYIQKVNALYKLRAKAASKLWRAADEQLVKERNAANERDEQRTRGNAMNFAKEWLDYARASGQSTADALALCVSAANTQEFCK
jgi:hypothetical protein